MNWKNITIYFVIVLLILIAIYDVIAISNSGAEASISNLFIVWSYKFPAFPFCVGFVMGHLFWRMKSNDDTKKLIDKEG